MLSLFSEEPVKGGPGKVPGVREEGASWVKWILLKEFKFC